MTKPLFSIVVPIYNRPDEAKELLHSLSEQETQNFELVLVEDGVGDAKPIVDEYYTLFPIQYFYLKDTSVCYRRNFGVKNAQADFYLFIDSDCIIPDDYFTKLTALYNENQFDAYGGRDAAMKEFSPFQQAVNYAMTSFLTTGGVRGNKKKIGKFYPRSFNMGFSKKVFEKTGGFPEDMQPPGEDMILSIRIHELGFKVASFPELYVYHKRKVSLTKFWKQIFSFAYVRIKITKMHPDTFKLIHLLPCAFVLFMTAALACLPLIVFSMLFILPAALLGFYFILIFADALCRTKNAKVAALSLVASVVQFWAYGLGLSTAFLKNK